LRHTSHALLKVVGGFTLRCVRLRPAPCPTACSRPAGIFKGGSGLLFSCLRDAVPRPAWLVRPPRPGQDAGLRPGGTAPISLIRRVIVALLPVVALAGLIALVVAVGGCERDATAPAPVATGPVDAVRQLADDLRGNDLVAYAAHALPPPLHARMAASWTAGHTIWPLTELPLDDRLPAFVTVLAAPDSEKTLLAAYQRQFAGADRELRTAAATLGLFAG